MKLILLSAYYPPETMGGAEISTHLLARGLAENGNDVKVITTGESEERVKIDGVDVIRINIPLKKKPLLERKHSRKAAVLLEQVEEELLDADIIHANDFRSVMAIVEWRRKQERAPAIIATIRDYAQISGSTNFINDKGELPLNSIEDAWQSHRISEARRIRRIFRWWQYRFNINYRKKTFGQLDGQVFISKAQMMLTSKHQNLSKIRKTVIFNPMDDSYLDEKLEWGHDGLVLYVGRVENYKGVGLLLEAWREIIKDIPQAYLKIIGDGVDKEKYEKIIEEGGMNYKVSVESGVRWSRVRRIYDEARVVVAPHVWFEPFGRTAAEAMSRGKIVVAANVGGPNEMIENNVSGILFERKSKNDLVAALRKALKGSDAFSRKMGREASDWTKRNLNKNDIARKYEEFYKEVMGK